MAATVRNTKHTQKEKKKTKKKKSINAQHSPQLCTYTVSQKNCAKLFLSELPNRFPPTVKIFGIKMAKRINVCEVYSFSTSPNLCQHTTVLNADVPNCYITL